MFEDWGNAEKLLAGIVICIIIFGVLKKNSGNGSGNNSSGKSKKNDSNSSGTN